MDHTPQDRQIPGQPSPAADVDRSTKALSHEQLSGLGPLAAYRGDQLDPHRPAGESGVGQLRWARCPDDGRLHLLQPADVVVAATGAPAEALCGLPLISADVAATALQDYFLANADRGDNAANDELVAELVRRIRTLRTSGEGGS